MTGYQNEGKVVCVENYKTINRNKALQRLGEEIESRSKLASLTNPFLICHFLSIAP